MTVGWRTGYVIAGVATACIAPLAWVLLTISQKRTKAEATATTAAKGATDGVAADADTLKTKMVRLVTSQLYWALTFAFVVCGVTTTGFMESHIITFAVHQGLTAQQGNPHPILALSSYCS